MKKRIAVSLIAGVTAFACLALTACGDDNKETYSETYEGTLSTQSYETPSAAAQAFVANEVTSDETPVTYKSYAKQKDLTEEEIAKLNLTEEQKADVESAEKGVISFTYTPKTSGGVTPTASAPSSSSSAEGTKVVYCVKFGTSAGGSYKYLAPLPENGEALSKSYYESVFNPESYKNVTAVYDMPITITSSMAGFTYSETMSMKCTVKVSETAIKMEVSAKEPDVQDPGNYITTTATAYLVDSANGILEATQVNGNWQTSNFTAQTGYQTISEMWSYNLPDIDFTHLVKTNYGFKVNSDYLTKLFDDIMQESGLDYSAFDGSLSMNADYYVKDGLLKRIALVAKMNMSVVEQGTTVKLNLTVKMTNSFSAFGTTSVTIPADAKAALGIE